MRNKKVWNAYNADDLTRVLTLPEYSFGEEYGMETVNVSQKFPHDYYHFRDNGSNVLAVAHLDTVVSPEGRVPHFTSTASGPKVTSGALDDRLGAYVILELLPALGVTCDWLLTVGEEDGQSTADFFKPAKDYDWIIEFDRMGSDVVMYQYEDAHMRDLVRGAGAAVGQGSFSDIAFLEHLNVKAFNWGVGYQGNYHSVNGFAYLGDTFSMVAKYLQFHEQNLGTTLPHEGYSQNLIYLDCDYCDARDSVDTDTWYCNVCGSCQDCGEMNPDIAKPEDSVCQCWAPAKKDDDGEYALTWEEWLASRPVEKVAA